MSGITLSATAAGRFTFPGTDISVNRMGYGAMQLAGPHVFGEPRDPDEARAVLREALSLDIDHIDTSDFYGPHVTNRLIREALHPYPAALTLVTKIGAWRNETGEWILRRDADFLRRSVEDNLSRLGLDQMSIVNLRMGGPEDDIETPMRAMRRMQEEGLLAHIGVSTVTERQLAAARDIAPVVCVQNHYNLVHREDDAMIDALAEEGIAYVPYFPLGGFTPFQADGLSAVAQEAGTSPQSVALAWLLQRSPNILVIPGTSSRGHLRENVAAAALQLSEAHLARLDALGRKG
ncbi:oxidoreductase [Aureimonas sp. ME7]|uniref:oxidoreductase n=1 Tax=Aureimonas sp. ME7 TaxID=2744252 RepID=UPI0015F761BD|nr:oxidoreductase [Aureimonas sp. ME7]